MKQCTEDEEGLAGEQDTHLVVPVLRLLELFYRHRLFRPFYEAFVHSSIGSLANLVNVLVVLQIDDSGCRASRVNELPDEAYKIINT